MLVLASASPRRREILTMLGYTFKVCAADADETVSADTPPCDAALLLARRKAGAVFAARPDCVVLGADTIVVIDGIMLGKPADDADCARMLRLLSGRTHEVFTGVSILSAAGETDFFRRTLVEFRRLTEREIADYISTGEPMDKAGGYGIQGRGATLIEGIQGDFFNVMGLPAADVHRVLADMTDSF